MKFIIRDMLFPTKLTSSIKTRGLIDSATVEHHHNNRRNSGSHKWPKTFFGRCNCPPTNSNGMRISSCRILVNYPQICNVLVQSINSKNEILFMLLYISFTISQIIFILWNVLFRNITHSLMSGSYATPFVTRRYDVTLNLLFWERNIQYVSHVCDFCSLAAAYPLQGWFLACAQPMRDVVTK